MIGFVAAQVLAALTYGLVLAQTGYAPNPATGLGAAFGEVAGRIGAGQAPSISEPLPLYLTALVQIPLWAGLLVVPLLATRLKGRGPSVDLGLRVEAMDVPVGLAVGIGCQLLMVPGLYWLLFKLIGTHDVSAVARGLTDRATTPLGVVALLVIVGVGAPVAEEIFFRGLLQGSLIKRGLDPRWAVLATAAIFAFSHFQPLQFPALLVFGIVVGLMTRRTGRLGPAIVTHLAFNMTAAIVLVAGVDWG